MTVRKKRKAKMFFIIPVITACFYAVWYCYCHIPASVYLTAGSSIDFKLPFAGSIKTESREVVLGSQEHIASDEVHMTWNEPLSVYSETTGSYELCLKLFGLFEVKNIDLEVVEPEYLLPCGIPTGIYLESNGVLVIGTSELTDHSGVVSEPALNILKTGDYIVAVNDAPVSDKETLMELVNAGEGKGTVLTIRRAGEQMSVRVHPVYTAAGEYKLGVWVRDDTQGIGTLTYIDAENHFGALGHGISDSDTNMLMEVSGGKLYQTDIRTIIKGTSGTPGSLSGTICYGEDNCYGQIESNTEKGIFGTVNSKLIKMLPGEMLPIGYKQEVHTGEAWIRCTMEGITKDYKIEILEVDTSSHNHNKGIVLQVTDQELLEKTGGIVQGMSGSPILQDGKIIGAVTHVFIQDAAKGYGIFIEEMR